MQNTDNSSRPAVLFLSHGGGPLPLLGDDGHKEMVKVLKTIPPMIDRPSSIIVISAHWEEEVPTITHGIKPPLLYDYYGFPEESYEIKYPAPGDPQLAEDAFSLLNEHGFNAVLDEKRGFDHGLFVPLKIMYPEANIPCIQISLIKGLDSLEHIKLGEALGGLKRDGLLVIGSGFSFHNMRAFFASPNKESQLKNESFENWLIETCTNRAINESERTQRLEYWESAPFARYCHPREEHLLPLHVCYGVAKRASSNVFEFNVLNKKASAYLW